MVSPEKGRVCFQNFIENDAYDIRVAIINKKAEALKRLVRKNDFGASGSGNLVFENQNMEKRFIELACKLSKLLRT